MINDFVKALAAGDSLEEVKERLTYINDRLRRAEDEAIQRDYTDAKAIVSALQCDPDRPAYKIAAAYLEEAKQTQISETAERDRREALRRTIESAYIQLEQNADDYFTDYDETDEGAANNE